MEIQVMKLMALRLLIAAGMGLSGLALSGIALAGAWLGDLTWEEAADALPSTLVIVPFAAGAKEHGPHLPLRTDELVLNHLLNAVIDGREVLVAPPILHGWFPAFRDYPGTEVADPAIFQNYVRAICESLVRHGAQRLVILNMGITRASGLPLAIVARDLRADHGVAMLVLSWDDLEDADSEQLYEQLRGGHADEGETSIVLNLRPDLVQMERAVTDYRRAPDEQIGYVPGHFDRETEAGLFGDPTLADEEKGAQLLAIMTRNLLRAIDQFSK